MVTQMRSRPAQDADRTSSNDVPIPKRTSLNATATSQNWQTAGAAAARIPLSFVAKIVALRDGRFRLDDHGEDARVVVVRDRWDEHIVDLVAYHEAKPSHWYYKEGDQTPVLGASDLASCAALGHSVVLHPRPYDWLAARGVGVVVLDWDAPLLDLFYGVGSIELGHLPAKVARDARQRLIQNFSMDFPRIRGAGR